MFVVVVSSKNTSEFGHLCVYENEGIQLLNGLWWGVCVTKLTGRDFVLFLSKCGGSQLSLLSVCVLFSCECVSLYCLKAFLYTIRYYCMVCVCLSVSEPTKHVPVCFSLLLKGSLDFGFIYLKNLFLSFFSLLTIIYCVSLLIIIS